MSATKLRWWIAALVAPALSCSLIVQFHDQSIGSGGDGGPGGDDAMDGGPDVEAAAVDNWNPCLGKTNGWRCGDNGLSTPLPGADLVHCEAGAINTLIVCEAGCLHVPDPFPDSCNPCAGVANGDYCGKQLSGFNPDNSDILIGCAGGQVGLQDACVHGCGANGSMSACY